MCVAMKRRATERRSLLVLCTYMRTSVQAQWSLDDLWGVLYFLFCWVLETIFDRSLLKAYIDLRKSCILSNSKAPRAITHLRRGSLVNCEVWHQLHRRKRLRGCGEKMKIVRNKTQIILNGYKNEKMRYLRWHFRMTCAESFFKLWDCIALTYLRVKQCDHRARSWRHGYVILYHIWDINAVVSSDIFARLHVDILWWYNSLNDTVFHRYMVYPNKNRRCHLMHYGIAKM